MNVAEVIPYKNDKEKFAIVFQELMKNRRWKNGQRMQNVCF
jgi:hypothetical protein